MKNTKQPSLLGLSLLSLFLLSLFVMIITSYTLIGPGMEVVEVDRNISGADIEALLE